MGIRNCCTLHTRCFRGLHTRWSVFQYQTVLRISLHRPRGREKDVWSRFAIDHIVASNDGTKTASQTDRLQHGIDVRTCATAGNGCTQLASINLVEQLVKSWHRLDLSVEVTELILLFLTTQQRRLIGQAIDLNQHPCRFDLTQAKHPLAHRWIKPHSAC